MKTFFSWILNGFKPRSTLYGGAEWMSEKELSQFASTKNKGLVLSPNHRLSEEDSFRNFACLAPTGIGKTTRYILPNILKCSGSFIATDPKGELYQMTSGHMVENGYSVQLLQPEKPTHSCGFNPCIYAKSHKDLRNLAKTLVVNSKSGGIWSVQAITLLYLGLLALKNANDPARFHLGNLRALLMRIDTTAKTKTTPVDDFMASHLPEGAFQEYLSFLRQNDRFIGDTLSTVMAALEPWSDPDIVAFTAHNTIDIDLIRKNKTGIYLVVPPHLVEYYSPVISLFYNTCFSHCIATANNGGEAVYFFLDEFGNLGQIPYFDAIATTLRSSRCSLNIILQEISQLVAVYGADRAKSIFSGGMGNKIFLSGLDVETASYLERLLGQTTAYDTFTGEIDPNARIAGKPLLAAYEARMLERSEAVLVSGYQKPIKMTMPHYSAHPKMDQWTKKPLLHFDLSLGLSPDHVPALALPAPESEPSQP